MKNLTLMLSVVFAAGLAFAGEDAHKTDAAKSDASMKADAKGHDVEVEVVSTDATKKTITIKTEKGENTVPVEGKAIASLKDVKPGQKVTVVCRDDDKGDHKAVTEIKTSKSETSAQRPAGAAAAPAAKNDPTQ
jgi:hypothetical protein